MRKILIIGSQGYLGSRLFDYLVSHGYRCDGVDIGFFKYGVIYYPNPDNPGRFKDARDVNERDLEGYDVVILLAGISNDPMGDLSPSRVYDPTRHYARRIAELCKRTGVGFIFPSSCSVYGIGGEEILDETSETNPQTAYSLNKLQIELDLAKLAGGGFSPIALRLATVFGVSPRIRFDVVVNMLCGMAVVDNVIKLNSDGQAWRPHVHIEDVCEAFRRCIDWGYDGQKLLVMNVGRDSNNCKVVDIATQIQKVLGPINVELLSHSADINSDELIRDRKIAGSGKDTRSYSISFRKIHELLPGFKARWTLEEGITDLLFTLKKLKLDNHKFLQRDFYRLQQLEFLLSTNQLDADLRYRENSPICR